MHPSEKQSLHNTSDFGHSIYSYLAVIVILVVTVVVGGYSTASYLAEKQRIVSTIEETTDIVAKTLRKNTAGYIEAYAVSEYTSMIKHEMEEHPGIFSIVISDYNMGKIIGEKSLISGASRSKDWQIIDIDASATLVENQAAQCFHYASGEIFSESDVPIGSVAICSSDKFLQQKLDEIIITNLVYAVTISILLFVLLFVLIRKLILSPISSIIPKLTQGNDGTSNQRNIPVQGAREIRILSSTLNNMIDTVKARESELKKSEESLRLLIENASDGIFIADMEGHYTDVNSAACRMLGFERNEIIGKTIMDFIPPEELQRLANEKDEMVDGDSQISEWTLLCKDGKYLPVEISANILPSKQWQAFVRDISERKEAEKELRYNEQRFRGLFESVGDYALVLENQDGGPPIIRDANQAAFTKHGYSREEMIGQPITLIDHHSEPATIAALLEKINSGDVCRFETTHTCKDGSTFPVEMSSQLIRNSDNRSVYFSIEHDISDSKKAREMVDKLSQAVMQSGEAVVITDMKGTIEYVNPSYTSITGYSKADAIGQNPNVLNSGKQSPAFYKEMWKTLTAGQPWQGKVVNKKKTGEFYPAMLTISPIKSEKGDITHYVGLQQSLEEYEALEAQFHQAQKMEAIGTLVGGIAHDFNNLLAGMTGNLYLAKKASQERPDVLDRLSTVEHLSYRAADLIKQLLTFARKGVIDLHPLSFTLLTKEALKLLRASIPENVTLNDNICSAPLVINGDETQVHQVLMNLVNNAHHAVENVDNPSIIIKLDTIYSDQNLCKKHPEMQPEIHYAWLSVEDNGCGVSDSQIERLFDPFYTTKAQGKGTGLGLAMVFGAVKTHDGHIAVESSVGVGTMVHVYLPLVKAELPELTITQEEVSIRGKGELILFVDDNQQVQEVGEGILESLGYRVLKASNGLEAVDVFIAHQNEISLIITDVVMPKLGGVEAIERIKEMHPDIKVIFLTGYDKGSISSNRIPSSEYTVLTKPFSVDSLSKTIRNQLKT